MTWYVRRGEREMGPLGEDALRALVGTGQITADTELWREGLSGWTRAGALPGVLGPRAAAPAVTISSPRAAVTTRDLAPPWRRYWARSLDIAVCYPLVTVLVSAIWPGLFVRVNGMPGQAWVTLLLMLPVALALDSVIYRAFGNTPGKAIAGIKVLQEGGCRPLRATAHLGRNFGVYVFGLACGVPLVSLFALIHGYRRAAAGEVSIWDRFSGSRAYVLSGAAGRTWLAAGICLAGLAAVIALGAHQRYSQTRYAAAGTPASILRQELAQAANRVNASGPRMIDGVTRLDGAHAGPGPLFTYDYTLTNISSRLLPAQELATLRWRLAADVRQAICAGSALRPILRTGVITRIHYRDRDGQDLVMVHVASADCVK